MLIDTHGFTMIREAMPVIEELGLVDFVKNFDDNTNGFSWSTVPEVEVIGNALEFQGHSGFSFAFVMRNCQYYFNNVDEWTKEVERHSVTTPSIVLQEIDEDFITRRNIRRRLNNENNENNENSENSENNENNENTQEVEL